MSSLQSRISKLCCRICLVDNPNAKMIHIFTEQKGVYEILDLIKFTSGLEITKKPLLPEFICSTCHKKLQNAKTIKREVLAADDFLKHYEEKNLTTADDEMAKIQPLSIEEIQKTLKCQTCHLKFDSRFLLQKHMKEHTIKMNELSVKESRTEEEEEESLLVEIIKNKQGRQRMMEEKKLEKDTVVSKPVRKRKSKLEPKLDEETVIIKEEPTFEDSDEEKMNGTEENLESKDKFIANRKSMAEEILSRNQRKANGKSSNSDGFKESNASTSSGFSSRSSEGSKSEDLQKKTSDEESSEGKLRRRKRKSNNLELKSSSDPKFECEKCKLKFFKEKALDSHMCKETKRKRKRTKKIDQFFDSFDQNDSGAEQEASNSDDDDYNPKLKKRKISNSEELDATLRKQSTDNDNFEQSYQELMEKIKSEGTKDGSESEDAKSDTKIDNDKNSSAEPENMEDLELYESMLAEIDNDLLNDSNTTTSPTEKKQKSKSGLKLINKRDIETEYDSVQNGCVDSKNNYKCAQCKQQFKQHKLLDSHLKECQKPFKCVFCLQKMNGIAEYLSHLLDHNTAVVNGHTCRFCKKTYTKITSLRDHMVNVHDSQKIFACTECGATFSKRNALNRHILGNHNDSGKNFSCKVCKKTFSRFWSLKLHERKMHSKDLENSCPYCGESFPKKLSLMKHVQFVHTKKRIIFCDICNKKEIYKSHMKLHMTVHMKEKKFKCTKCNCCFKSNDMRMLHQVIHSPTPTKVSKVYSKKVAEKSISE